MLPAFDLIKCECEFGSIFCFCNCSMLKITFDKIKCNTIVFKLYYLNANLKWILMLRYFFITQIKRFWFDFWYGNEMNLSLLSFCASKLCQCLDFDLLFNFCVNSVSARYVTVFPTLWVFRSTRSHTCIKIFFTLIAFCCCMLQL